MCDSILILSELQTSIHEGNFLDDSGHIIDKVSLPF